MKGKIAVLIITTVFIIGTISFAFAEKQPHMQAALKNLHQAKAQLEKATHDKGGHRVKAIELINQAIAEVKQGVAYDDANPEKPKPPRK